MNNYDKNVFCLGDDFKKELKEAKKPDWYFYRKAKNGDYSFSIIKAGMVFDGHDQSSPRRFGKEITKHNTLSKTEAMILIGSGIGHEINQIFKKAEKGFTLVVVEPIYYLIKRALSNYDFSKFLEEKRLIFVTNQDTLSMMLGFVEQAAVIESWSITINPYTFGVPEKYKDLTQYSGSVLNTLRCNTGTMMGAGSIIAQNDLKNLPYLLQFPGIDELKDEYKGKAAVIVSTGPSLTKNINLLLDREVRNKVVVICVAQAARALLAYRITPDYMCTVDYGEVNASHFAGLEDCGVPLIALNRTYAPIFETWKSPVYVATSLVGERDSITDVWLNKGRLEQGGSVSHFALGLAIHMGCKNIALMGQDLAYEGNRSHIELADSSGSLEIKDGQIDWEVKDPRSSIHNKDFKMGPAVDVPAYWGGVVKTNMGLASFIQTFSVIGKAFNNNFYNCTEGGAHIDYFKETTLRSFLDRFAKKTFDKMTEVYRYADNWETDVKLAITHCASDKQNLSEVVLNCDLGLDTLELMAKFITDKQRDKSERFKELLAENEEFSKEAQKMTRKNPLLEASIYKASREIAGKKLYVSGQHLDKNDEALKTRIERNKLILKSAKKESGKLLFIYGQVEIKLRKLLGDKNAMRGQTPNPPSLEDAEEYLENGNWAMPLLEIERIRKNRELTDKEAKVDKWANELMRQSVYQGKEFQEKQAENEKKLRINSLVKEAKKAGSKDKNFKKAYLCLLYASRIDSTDIGVKHGLASSALLLGKYDKAIRLYEELETTSSEFFIRFEHSLALMNSGAVKSGFEKLEKLMNETEQYDYILYDVSELFYKSDLDNAKEKAVELLKIYIKKFSNNLEAKKRLKEWTK